MANYESVVISNDFKVKNPKEFFNVFNELGFEYTCINNDNTVCIASYEQCWDSEHVVVIEKQTKKFVGVITSWNIDCLSLEEWIELKKYNYKVEDLKEITVEEYIQTQLLDDSYCAIKETGNEKLRYNVGFAEVITKNNIKFFNLDQLVQLYVLEELSNTDKSETQFKV